MFKQKKIVNDDSPLRHTNGMANRNDNNDVLGESMRAATSN